METTAVENERVRVTLEQATREIELLEEMGRLAGRRRNGHIGILIADDEPAREYQRLDAERERLRKTREAKLRALATPTESED
jgi:ERCC4-related helicase